jgi:hypothetical protein
MHPANPTQVASRVRKYALAKKQHWLVIQRALEAIAAYPYVGANALTLATTYIKHKHSMVRRAACTLLTRGPKHEVRNQMSKLMALPFLSAKPSKGGVVSLVLIV